MSTSLNSYNKTDLQEALDTLQTNITNELDGNWTNRFSTLDSGSVFSSSSTLTYDLSNYLPDDGEIYEVIFAGAFSTGQSAGYTVEVRINTDIITNALFFARCTTLSSSAVVTCGQIVLPVGSGRYVTLINGSTTYNCNISAFRVFGYRKVR